jgi:hypothetical protein
MFLTFTPALQWVVDVLTAFVGGANRALSIHVGGVRLCADPRS